MKSSLILHSSSASPYLLAVPVGVLDDASHFRPSTHIFTGSALRWVQSMERPHGDRRGDQARDLPGA